MTEELNKKRPENIKCILDENLVSHEDVVVWEEIVLCQECVRKVLIPLLKGELARFCAESDPSGFDFDNLSFDDLDSSDLHEVFSRTIDQVRTRIEELNDNFSGRWWEESVCLLDDVLNDVLYGEVLLTCERFYEA